MSNFDIWAGAARTAVFAGMLGVKLFGIFLTPVFYYVIQWVSDVRRNAKQTREPESVHSASV
jgi:multidrug efflux pump